MGSIEYPPTQPSAIDQGYKPIADLYDYVIPYRTRPDVDFFVKQAVTSAGPVLELGCGTGRVLIPTARAGITIAGLDSSSAMLEVCRGRLQRELPEVQSRVLLVEGDMRRFALGQVFRLVTLPFRPFQHLLNPSDQISCLQCIGRHLDRDGRLILDIFNPSLESLVAENLEEEQAEEPEFTTPDGRRVIRRHKVVARDRTNQVLRIELIYEVRHPDDREERLVQAAGLRYFFRFEAEHLLARCGFEVEHLYGDYDESSYRAKESPELIFVAKKTAV